MKGKQLLLLLVLVGALGYAGYTAFQGSRESWSQSGSGGAGSKVVEFPINDVAQVQIKNASGEVNLMKGDDWTIKERADYPANFEQVGDLLRKVWDLKTVQAQKVGPSQLGRLELVAPGEGENTGTLLDLKDKEGKSLAAMVLGKKDMRNPDGEEGGGFATGRYVMPVGAKSMVSLVTQTFDELEPKPERWLRKDFIKIENPKSIALVGTTDAMKWTVSRDSTTAEWKLADAKGDEKLDTAKTGTFGSAFSSPSFKDVLAPDAKPADTGLDKPSTLKIETTDGFTYMLEVGKLTDEAYPVRVKVDGKFAKERTPGKDEKPEDKTKLDEEFKATLKKHEDKLAAEKKFEARLYLLEKFTVEPFVKERAALLPEKKPETPPTPPAPGATPPFPTPPPPAPTTPPSAATPKPGPITVTTPPVSIPAATSPPVAVPPETPKPVTPPAPAPEPPAKPAPAPKPPAPNPAPAEPAKPAPPQ